MKNIFLFFIFILLLSLKNTIAQNIPVQRIDIVDEALEIYSTDISEDGNQIITGTFSPIIWDYNTGQKLFDFKGHGLATIRSVDFSKNNNLVASGDGSFNAIVWNRITGEVVQQFRGFERNPLGEGIKVVFTPDSRRLITASNSTMQLWNISTGEELMRYPKIGLISSVLIHPNGKYVFLESGGVGMINIDTGEIEKIFVNLKKQSISNDGNVIQGIIQLNSGEIKIEQYNTNTGKLINSYLLNTEVSPNAIDMSPDGKNYLIGNTIRKNGATEVLNRVLFDAVTPGSIRSYIARENAEKDSPESEDEIIKYFPNGRKFLTVNGKSVHIWDISDVVTRVRDAGVHNN